MYIKNINKNILHMRIRMIAREVPFWKNLGRRIDIKEDEKLFKEYGGIAKYLNKELKALVEDIKKNRVSLVGFTIENAAELAELFSNKKLNQKVLDELNHLFYGGDERIRYFGNEEE